MTDDSAATGVGKIEKLIAQLRRLVDDQTGGDAVVLVQRQLFNKTVGSLAALRQQLAEAQEEMRDLQILTSSQNRMIVAQTAQNAKMAAALRALIKYARWQMENTAYHPTLPSALFQADAVLSAPASPSPVLTKDDLRTVVALTRQNAQMAAALRPFADFCPQVESFIDARVKAPNVAKSMFPTQHFRLAHFQAARDALPPAAQWEDHIRDVTKMIEPAPAPSAGETVLVPREILGFVRSVACTCSLPCEKPMHDACEARRLVDALAAAPTTGAAPAPVPFSSVELQISPAAAAPTTGEIDAPASDGVWSRIASDPALARARSKLSIHELRTIIRHARTAAAPTTGEMVQLLREELRERTAMRYAGDCKCGGCQLVPRKLIDRLLAHLAAAPAPSAGETRAAIIEQCAWIAQHACLVPPDGGSPTQAECDVADEAARRIRALAAAPTTGETP